jgi:hypothetical protein
MNDPTEMAGVAEADTQHAHAWGALDYGDVDEFPTVSTGRLTPRHITALGLAASLVLIAVAGAVALFMVRDTNTPVAQAPSSSVVETVVVAPPRPAVVTLPDQPPANKYCSGAVVGHSDVKHPQLGMMRVFLLLDQSQSVYSTGRGAGCALPVTHTGRVLPAIGVDAFVGNGFGLASPATDATGNVFVKYQNASNFYGSGLIVLIPNADGFENVISYLQMHDPSGYPTGVNDYYGAELIGPVDGVYSIRQVEHTCEPNCAQGGVIVRNLHWDGREYVPETPPPAAPVQAPPPAVKAAPSPVQAVCTEGATRQLQTGEGDPETCENGQWHEGPYGYLQGGG